MRYLALLLVLSIGRGALGNQPRQHDDFDVVIAGGSTAAFAAAVTAAQEGARVALLEPTDWVGGQLTSSGVPAIDEAWHKLRDREGNEVMNVAQLARDPRNMTPILQQMLQATGCPGNCWVSRFCFLPEPFLQDHLKPLAESLPNLMVFRNTVVKQAETMETKIVALVAIQRHWRGGPGSGEQLRNEAGYDRLPSNDLPDWYSAETSPRFGKTVHTFVANRDTVFVDATEWGELLALSSAPYLIGVEHVDGGLAGDESLGQAITYGFVQELHATSNATRDSAVPMPVGRDLGLGDYRDKPNGWESVWTYRRLASTEKAIQPGDLSLQNWGYYPEKQETGNDYPFGYLFLTKADTENQCADWQGGIDLRVLGAAEQHAFAWHHYFKSLAPREIGPDQISLSVSTLGTTHGLSKLPYIRDTRRSIGINDFVLRVADLVPVAPGELARQFPDRIALGAYPVDIHPLSGRDYPDYIDDHYDIAPFTIPFRALTNRRYGNLLVAGKTMAQSFLANSATRLHPTEWSTGTAAGVAAAFMYRHQKTARDMFADVESLQRIVKKYTPVDWSVDGSQ